MIKIFLTTIFCINLFANQIDLSGTVISDNEKIISSRNMGLIKEVYVSEGTNVKKGDILYEIDSSNIDSNKKELELNLQIQQNQLQNMELNHARYKRLQEQDLVSKYDVEQLELNISNTKNMISITKTKLKEINAQYDYLKIKAPNNGLIIKKSIKAGEMSMPAMPALILTDLSNLLIKADISETNLNDIKINQEVDIEIPSQNFKTKGKIEAIIPNVVGMTHSFVIKISFDKKDFNDEYLEELRTDLVIFKELVKMWGNVDYDPKLEKFKSLNKPFRRASVLDEFADEIFELQKEKYSFTQISEYLKFAHNVEVSKQRISTFIKSRKNDIYSKEDTKNVKDDNSQDANKKVEKDEKTNQKKLEEYFKLFDRNK